MLSRTVELVGGGAYFWFLWWEMGSASHKDDMVSYSLNKGRA